MPHVFRTFRTRVVSRDTGARELILDRKGRPVPHERWRFTYIDAAGRRRTDVGGLTADETEKMALRKQVHEDEIRMGIRQAPKSYDSAKARPFKEVSAACCAEGEAHGGHGGRP